MKQTTIIASATRVYTSNLLDWARCTLLLILCSASIACGQWPFSQAQFLAPPMANAADNRLSEKEISSGWFLLFDGQTLDQWRTYNQEQPGSGWLVENGVMVLNTGGGGDLITKGQWSDFEMSLDWQISIQGNSGVFFLADESELPIFVHAPEIQILDNERHADRKKANHRSGSLYDMVAAPSASQRPAGVWNNLRIKLEARRLQVWQNDVESVDILLDSQHWRSLVASSKFSDWPGFGENLSGHIGLQDHSDPVAFKNVKIRPL